MKKLFSILILFVLLLSLIVGCTPTPTPTPTPGPTIPEPDPNIKMPATFKLEGGSSPGAGSDLQSAGVEEVLEIYFPDMATRRFPCGTAEATIMVQHNELDLAFYGVLQNVIPQWKGEYPGYEGEKMQDTRMLGASHCGLLGHIFYVPADSPYETVADLLEKDALRIGVGPTGSASWKTCQWALESYGLSYDDIEAAGGLVHFGSVKDAATMMAEGKLDSFAYGLPHPSSLLKELDLKRGVRCLPWSEAAIEAATGPADHGLFPITLPSGTYSGTPDDVTIISYSAVYIVNKDMSDDVAYNLAAAVFSTEGCDLMAERALFVKGYIEQTPDMTATISYPVPYHPGALKYWKERGITPTVDPL